jgi:hypothetical protein
MTRPKDHPISLIYTAATIQGDFIAFWESEEHDLISYLPDYPEKYRSVPIGKWIERGRESVASQDQTIERYDDVVNAAWCYLGQSMILVDKSSVSHSVMKLGTYYPRIWRGRYNPSSLRTYSCVNPFIAFGNKYSQSIVATTSLFEGLAELFLYIEPEHRNGKVFSHRIRELLILICTEMESAWQGVILDNSKSHKKRYSTQDYIKLDEPLRLREWGVRLVDYPDAETFRPFLSWSKEDPTKSLNWYDAYNAIKHNREVSFARSTLNDLLNAAAALHIMQASQWGTETYSRFHGNRVSPFYVVNCPLYRHSELYIPNIGEGENLTPIRYFDRESDHEEKDGVL